MDSGYYEVRGLETPDAPRSDRGDASPTLNGL